MTTYATRPLAPTRALPQPLPRPTLRRWWADAVGLTVWANLLVVTALWVSHGGVQALADGAGAALTSVSQVVGLWASALLLLQVLAMARITWVERAVGQDRISRWHRWIGFTSFNLMVVHVLAVTVGYALLDRIGVLGELWSLVTTAPGMLLAAAGTAALVMVTVTSVRAARRRLRYESWHLLHLYAYLGAGLALPHQLWTGGDFVSSPVATVYWWTLWALAAGAVLVYRVALPLVRTARHRLVVSEVVPEGRGVVSIRMTGRDLDRLRVAAGQFFVWRFRTGPGWTRAHPLSLSASPTTDGLRVTLNVTGDDGARLASLRPGTPVMIEGPYGRLTPEVRTRRGMALLGSGLGVAPLVAVLQDAVASGALDRPATFVRRVRADGDQPLDADLTALAQAGWVRVVDVTGPRSTVRPSWLPADAAHLTGPHALRLLVPDLDDCDVYVCGTSGWVEAVADDARTAGVPSAALHVEHFTW